MWDEMEELLVHVVVHHQSCTTRSLKLLTESTVCISQRQSSPSLPPHLILVHHFRSSKQFLTCGGAARYEIATARSTAPLLGRKSQLSLLSLALTRAYWLKAELMTGNGRAQLMLRAHEHKLAASAPAEKPEPGTAMLL